MKERIFAFFSALALLLLFNGWSTAGPKYVAGLTWNQMFHSNGPHVGGKCTAEVLDLPGYMNVTCSWDVTSDVVTADIYWRYGSSELPVCPLVAWTSSEGTVSRTCQLPYGPPMWSRSLLDKQLSVVFKTLWHPEGEIRGQLKLVTIDQDIDGDGRADPTVFRTSSSTSLSWSTAMGGIAVSRQFPGYFWENRPLAADFDGDGLADLAACHIDWNSGEWLWVYTRSIDSTVTETSWGNEWLNDQEAYGDFDGDGSIDVAVFRQNSGIWYILRSSDGQPQYDQFGTLGDRAVPADYDGDGRADLAVVREEKGRLAWYIRRSSDGSFYRIEWGLASDTIFPEMPADVDADGANDIVVARNEAADPTAGWRQRYFYALRSSDKKWQAIPWGVSSDGVRLGDFDGDGKTDFAAIRLVNGRLTWFVTPGRSGVDSTFDWGIAGDQ